VFGRFRQSNRQHARYQPLSLNHHILTSTPHGSRSFSDAAAPSWLASVYRSLIDYLTVNGYNPKVFASGAAQSLCPLHEDRVPSLSLHPIKGWMCPVYDLQGRAAGELVLSLVIVGLVVSWRRMPPVG